jgi:glucose-1-phosphate thymidylyltransferase
VCDFAARVKPSRRGELEITDLNRMYLDARLLKVEVMGRGHAWLDTGTVDSLIEAAAFIQTIEKRQGLKVCCPEEIAFRNGWLSKDELVKVAEPLARSGYGAYLLAIAEEVVF